MATDTMWWDFAVCCRTCLNDTSMDSYNIYSKREGSPELAELLRCYLSLRVEPNDGLPEQLCAACHSCLTTFDDFRKLAEEADTKLRKQLEESRDMENEVKLEPEFCEDNHNIYDDVFDVEFDPVSDDEKKGNGKRPKYNEFEVEFDPLLSERKTRTKKRPEDQSSTSHTCCICSEQVSSKSNLKAHVKTHSELKCDICEQTFEKYTKLEQHKLKHTVKEMYKCHVCSETFNQHENIIKHLEQNKCLENRNKDDVTKKQEICKVCFAKYKSQNALAAHMKIHIKKGRVLACSVCDKVFKKISHLKRHELCHDSKKPLEGHENKHNNVRPYVCDLCDKAFGYRHSLIAHLRFHTKAALLCTMCGKKFESKSNLTQHIRRHMGLKKFVCDLCPMKFVTKGELECHHVVHTGERKYSCPECGAAFTKHSSLTAHARAHRGEKPYSCHVCLKRFASRSNLRRHLSRRRGSAGISRCARLYAAQEGKDIHKCPECPQTFKLPSELRRHESEHLLGKIPPDPLSTPEEDSTAIHSNDTPLNLNNTLLNSNNSTLNLNNSNLNLDNATLNLSTLLNLNNTQLKLNNMSLNLNDTPLNLNNTTQNFNNMPFNLNTLLNLNNTQINLNDTQLNLNDTPLNLNNTSQNLNNTSQNLNNTTSYLTNAPLNLNNIATSLIPNISSETVTPVSNSNTPLNITITPLIRPNTSAARKYAKKKPKPIVIEAPPASIVLQKIPKISDPPK